MNAQCFSLQFSLILNSADSSCACYQQFSCSTLNTLLKVGYKFVSCCHNISGFWQDTLHRTESVDWWIDNTILCAPHTRNFHTRCLQSLGVNWWSGPGCCNMPPSGKFVSISMLFGSKTQIWNLQDIVDWCPKMLILEFVQEAVHQ